MANSYTSYCSFIPLDEIPQIDKVLKAWRILDERDSPEDHLPFNTDEPGGMEIERSYGCDGAINGIYVSALDGWLNEELFHRFFALMFKNGWITASYVGIECAMYCDKLRPGEFGGFYLRVTPEGDLLGFGTGALDALTNDQLREIGHYVRHPTEFKVIRLKPNGPKPDQSPLPIPTDA